MFTISRGPFRPFRIIWQSMRLHESFHLKDPLIKQKIWKNSLKPKWFQEIPQNLVALSRSNLPIQIKFGYSNQKGLVLSSRFRIWWRIFRRVFSKVVNSVAQKVIVIFVLNSLTVVFFFSAENFQNNKNMKCEQRQRNLNVYQTQFIWSHCRMVTSV